MQIASHNKKQFRSYDKWVCKKVMVPHKREHHRNLREVHRQELRQVCKQGQVHRRWVLHKSWMVPHMKELDYRQEEGVCKKVVHIHQMVDHRMMRGLHRMKIHVPYHYHWTMLVKLEELKIIDLVKLTQLIPYEKQTFDDKCCTSKGTYLQSRGKGGRFRIGFRCRSREDMMRQEEKRDEKKE